MPQQAPNVSPALPDPDAEFDLFYEEVEQPAYSGGVPAPYIGGYFGEITPPTPGRSPSPLSQSVTAALEAFFAGATRRGWNELRVARFLGARFGGGGF
ncbi:hypothetical protein TWF730_001400 [Orbilia blumenaviensis]|uniref:Uncharacterized protein n=1 Tax=Orbilia blumenaviensis TaxID=1796055 RepID=A0AAV9UHL5_9PEZI